MDIDESFVPQEIKEKIEILNGMLREAKSIAEEITEWYHEALLGIDPSVDVNSELFDAASPLIIEGIDFNAIMEGICTLSIFKEASGRGSKTK